MTQPAQRPSVGRFVHYVSFGTPGGEYGQECRAAVVTEVGDDHEGMGHLVGLAVFNPAGLFFRSLNEGGCEYDDGQGDPGDPDCPGWAGHEHPAAYCGRQGCTWRPEGYRGGTYHWPERV